MNIKNIKPPKRDLSRAIATIGLFKKNLIDDDQLRAILIGAYASIRQQERERIFKNFKFYCANCGCVTQLKATY